MTDYSMEELLPLTAELAEKFTSKESSSVTYETAVTLMGAVMYCIHECSEGDGLALQNNSITAAEAYSAGYDRAVEKVCEAKECYHRIAENFEDYGCRNYRDTVLFGMPEFFLRYDVKFHPQDHILTLDYPAACQHEYTGLCGIDLISRYLLDLETEKIFLECFDPRAVRKLVEELEICGTGTYMGNLCVPVLLRAVGSIIAGKQVAGLKLAAEDLESVYQFFQGSTREETEKQAIWLIDIISEKAGLSRQSEYFRKLGREISARIFSGLEFGTLDAVFEFCR